MVLTHSAVLTHWRYSASSPLLSHHRHSPPPDCRPASPHSLPTSRCEHLTPTPPWLVEVCRRHSGTFLCQTACILNTLRRSRRLDLNKTRSLHEVHINSLTPPSPRRSVVVTRLIILVLLILIQFHFVCLQMDLSNNNILPAPPSRAAVGYQKTAAVTSRATGVERRGMTRSVVELEVCGEIYGLFC